MNDLIHPTKSQILRIHQAILKKDRGSDGLRDHALLESPLAAPQATFRGTPTASDPIEIAASLIPLKLNGFKTAADGPEWEALILDVAASRTGSRTGKAELSIRLKTLASEST